MGSKLRALELPHDSCHLAFFTALESNCRQLKTLVIKGEPMSQGPICICHSKLEIHFVHETSHSLDLNCPNLTCLGITGQERGRHPTCYSLHCPKLTKLKLSSTHCTPELLKSIALCAPHITLVQVECDKEFPYDALTDFGSLKHLSLQLAGNDIPPLAFQWPHLETLSIDENAIAS